MNNSILYSTLVRPVVTERSTRLKSESNSYVFEVASRANKDEIKYAVEKLFKVTVLGVRTAKIPGKLRRVGSNRGGYQADWKKAFVRLKAGQEIKIGEDA